jgi:hypothetical protein
VAITALARSDHPQARQRAKHDGPLRPLLGGQTQAQLRWQTVARLQAARPDVGRVGDEFVRVAGTEAGAGNDRCDQPLDVRRVESQVAVEEYHDVARDLGRGGVHGARLPLVRPAEQAHRREPAHHVGRAVRRAVVHHDDVHVAVRLREQRGQALRDVPLLIVRGDDDADAGAQIAPHRLMPCTPT